MEQIEETPREQENDEIVFDYKFKQTVHRALKIVRVK